MVFNSSSLTNKQKAAAGFCVVVISVTVNAVPNITRGSYSTTWTGKVFVVICRGCIRNFQSIDMILDPANKSEKTYVSIFFSGWIFCGFLSKDKDICFLNSRVFCQWSLYCFFQRGLLIEKKTNETWLV